MFQNFDPKRMVIGEQKMSRRSALAGLGGFGALAGASALTGAGVMASSTAQAAKS